MIGFSDGDMRKSSTLCECEVATVAIGLCGLPKVLWACFTEPTALAAGLVVITQPLEARG